MTKHPLLLFFFLVKRERKRRELRGHIICYSFVFGVRILIECPEAMEGGELFGIGQAGAGQRAVEGPHQLVLLWSVLVDVGYVGYDGSHSFLGRSPSRWPFCGRRIGN